MQHDQPTATLAVALPGHGYMTEAAEAAAGMEIDTNDGTVADASMLPPGQGQARTTCQKWRALLGLAACDLMLSADTSMARRLTQGSPEQKGASTRSQSVWTAPALLDAATRFRVWHTRETSPHTDVCNRSTVTAKGRLQQSFSVYRSMHPHTTPMTLPPSPRHEEGRPTTRAPARAHPGRGPLRRQTNFSDEHTEPLQ